MGIEHNLKTRDCILQKINFVRIFRTSEGDIDLVNIILVAVEFHSVLQSDEESLLIRTGNCCPGANLEYGDVLSLMHISIVLKSNCIYVCTDINVQVVAFDFLLPASRKIVSQNEIG